MKIFVKPFFCMSITNKRKRTMNIQTILARVLPFTRWFEGYNFGKLRLDLISGITVALVLIPQSMAYAQLAGLPAYYGLYAAFLPPMIASLFGSSNQLATGPVAVVSLMSAASLEPLATAGSAEFIAYSIVLALTVGVFQFSLGVLRLGLVVNFLSHPVVNGFTNAAAIIIASSQFSKFFGVQVDKLPHHYETMMRVAEAAMDYTHLPTLMFGIGAVAIMVILRRIDPRIPNVLVAVVIATIISYLTGFNKDAYVPVQAIKDSETVQKIEAFNAAVREIKSKSEQRAGIAADVEEEKRRLDDAGLHNSSELVMLQSKVEIINLELADAKHHASALRESLRSVKLSADPSGNAYYSKGADSAAPAASNTIWRLAVGNQPIDVNRLEITGGGAIVGKIPAGLPSLKLPELKINTFVRLLPVAIIISLLGFMEAIAIAKAMAAKTGQKLDPNQELIGQGLANIIGSMGSSYAISGSFSRSAVNLQAGAVTGLSSVVTSFIVVITLLFFTPLLYFLPQAVLAAIIMMAVIGLVNVKSFVHAWHAQWYDGLISIITFVVTLYFAPHLDKGIMVGVVLSMGVFLYKSMRPVVASLSMNEEKVLQSAEYYRLQGCKHISVVRFDGALFFANASYLDEQVLKFRNDRPDLRYILLDARGINDMDASGEEALSLLVKRIRSADLGFAMCGVKGQVLNVMKRTGLYDEIGPDHIYADSRAAISSVLKILHTGTDLPAEGCKNCPLTTYLPLAENRPREPLRTAAFSKKSLPRRPLPSTASLIPSRSCWRPRPSRPSRPKVDGSVKIQKRGSTKTSFVDPFFVCRAKRTPRGPNCGIRPNRLCRLIFSRYPGGHAARLGDLHHGFQPDQPLIHVAHVPVHPVDLIQQRRNSFIQEDSRSQRFKHFLADAHHDLSSMAWVSSSLASMASILPATSRLVRIMVSASASSRAASSSLGTSSKASTASRTILAKETFRPFAICSILEIISGGMRIGFRCMASPRLDGVVIVASHQPLWFHTRCTRIVIAHVQHMCNFHPVRQEPPSHAFRATDHRAPESFVSQPRAVYSSEPFRYIAGTLCLASSLYPNPGPAGNRPTSRVKSKNQIAESETEGVDRGLVAMFLKPKLSVSKFEEGYNHLIFSGMCCFESLKFETLRACRSCRIYGVRGLPA